MEQKTHGNRPEHSGIQWFPGHMTRTLRMMEQEIRHVDGVVQLLDARIPRSSLNPELVRITKGKPHLYILNKADLADPEITVRWVRFFEAQGAGCLAFNSLAKGGTQQVKKAIEALLSALLAQRTERGMTGARRTLMVVGIPNVGKSTFINHFAGSVRAKAADKPGVTRGRQWVTVGSYDLLDMPGVLWKKFESPEVAGNLAFIGSIRDEILDRQALAASLLGEIQRLYPERILERYRVAEEDLADTPYRLLEAIGRRRGCLVSGGEVDLERTSIMLIDEFRGAKLGRISLERPDSV